MTPELERIAGEVRYALDNGRLPSEVWEEIARREGRMFTIAEMLAASPKNEYAPLPYKRIR